MIKIKRRELIDVLIAGGASKSNFVTPPATVTASATVSGQGAAAAQVVVNGDVVAHAAQPR